MPPKYSAKQWYAIQARLKREGKWDENRHKRARSEYIANADTQPLNQDYDLSTDEEFEAEANSGKSKLMSNYEHPIYRDLSDRTGTIALECNEGEIPKSGPSSPTSDLESSSQNNNGQNSSDLSFLYEGRDIRGKAKQAERARKGYQISGSSGNSGEIGGIYSSEKYVRDNMLILLRNDGALWSDHKSMCNDVDLPMLQDYFKGYNSLGVVIKCLPDKLEDVDTAQIFHHIRYSILDPFVLVSERSQEGILHWHMLWLTSKRTDNAKRLLQKTLLPISKHFSITVQQTKSFNNLLRYILKEPLVLGIAHSDTLADYCYALCKEPEVYKKLSKTENSDNKMIQDLLKVMNEKQVYDTEGLMREARDVMIHYLHKSNLESIVQNCKLFLLKPNDTVVLLNRLTVKITPGPFFTIFAYLMYQCIDPLHFLCDFFNIFCKLTDKRNAFCIQGPSNTGKTSFLRPLLEHVQFGEIVSGGHFMFQNCINKEVLIWEEPLIGPDFVEMCKRVFEGMTTQVPVKFKPPQTLYRTPVFITTNKDVWYYCDNDEMALRNRMVIYYFNHPASDFLKQSSTWWRQCYDCYSGCCREISEYITGCHPDSAARFKSTEQAGAGKYGAGSELPNPECECGSPSSQPVDQSTLSDSEW